MANKAKVNIHTARPGIVIGKRASRSISSRRYPEVDAWQGSLHQYSRGSTPRPRPAAGGRKYRFAARTTRGLSPCDERSGAACDADGRTGRTSADLGRLGGAEIARREWYREGRVPLQTLRADVAYGFAEARTTYGSSASRCGFSARFDPAGRRRPSARARHKQNSGVDYQD